MNVLTALLNLNLSPFNGVCNPSMEGNALLSSACAASIRLQLSHFPDTSLSLSSTNRYGFAIHSGGVTKLEVVVVVRSTTEEEEEIDEGGYLGCDDAEDGGGGSLGPANVEEEE